MIKYGKMSNEIHRELNGFVNPIYVFKGFGSHWVAGTKGGLHLDAQDPEPFIEFSTIMYLNAESDYDGGKIYFPNQAFEYQPKQYSAVFFPSAGSEYIHGITKVTRGNRYTALFMHTSLPEHVDPEFHPGLCGIRAEECQRCTLWKCILPASAAAACCEPPDSRTMNASTPAGSDTAAAAPPSAWQRFLDGDVFHSFRNNPVAIGAAIVAAIMMLGALFAPLLAPYDPFDLKTLDLNNSLMPPAWTPEGKQDYLLGTDDQGRDVLSTILYGSRISLLVGLSSVAVALVRGVGLGLEMQPVTCLKSSESSAPLPFDSWRRSLRDAPVVAGRRRERGAQARGQGRRMIRAAARGGTGEARSRREQWRRRRRRRRKEGE
jgi:hypothetical protein